MPSMANIIVKKADGTTDTTYTALTPSAGDGAQAQWRQNDQVVPAHRPVVSMRTQWNGPRTARKVVFNGKFPYVDPVTGVVTAIIPLSFDGTLPNTIPDTWTAEAIHQFGNLFVSTLIRESMKAGVSPT